MILIQETSGMAGAKKIDLRFGVRELLVRFKKDNYVHYDVNLM